MNTFLNRNFILGGLCATLLFCCAPNSAVVRSTGVVNPEYALQIQRAQNIVAPLVRRGSAVSVAVGVDGDVVWSEGFGYASMDEDSTVTPDDSFRLYSLMKQLTAIVALQSVLNGEITFETSAREVFPELPEIYEGVTLQQLITHTAGIRHYHHPQEAQFFNHCEKAETAIHQFVNDPLGFEPGSQESYSTYGFVLASAMLEHRAGKPFGQLVQERLAMPAGVDSLELDSRQLASTLQYYDVDEDGNVNISPPIDNSCKMGGGGFRASAEDFVRLHNAALNGELVPLPAMQQLLGGRSSLVAAGSGTGGEAVSVVDLESRISVVVLSNTSGLEQQIALERARGLLLDVFSH